jgi:predicted DNA binding CopG/RHH family protein
MKYYNLTDEEKKLLKEVEGGEWVPLQDQTKAKKEASEAARNTLNKTKNINIRLSERTVARLKRKAVEEGIPYQTLVSSVLHKFASK